MKFFDLTIPKPGETNPKIFKVENEAFKQALVDIPRELAERMVELGYGHWVPITAEGKVPVPQAFHYPDQIVFVKSPTLAVKACHVNALIEEPVPANLVHFCHNLKEDINFTHSEEDLDDDPEDLKDPEDELVFDGVPVESAEAYVPDPKDAEDVVLSEEDELEEILDQADLVAADAVVAEKPTDKVTAKKAKDKASEDKIKELKDTAAKETAEASDALENLAEALSEESEKTSEKIEEEKKDDVKGDAKAAPPKKEKG